MENKTKKKKKKITDESPRSIENQELETLIIASIETTKNEVWYR